MQHVEIIDNNHFQENYERAQPAVALSHLVDFYWQTKFDGLWEEHPRGFSDVLFPNIGYSYLVNLGTPFIMQVGKEKFNMKTDGYLPRHQSLECFHQPGNILFGIKFKISPIIFEKNVNFSEYTSGIFPLSYLVEKTVLAAIKKGITFEERVDILNSYFLSIVNKYEGAVLPITIVSSIITECTNTLHFTEPLEEIAAKHKISVRTLQRYFEKCTGVSTKKTLQILRIRKAVEEMAFAPEIFEYLKYGFYDYSHFYKNLQYFLPRHVLQKLTKTVINKK
jgi:AraC-like DNA-binding protein